jgi:hypothetical protein
VQKNKPFYRLRHSLATAKEENGAKRLILRQFKAVIDFSMHIAGAAFLRPFEAGKVGFSRLNFLK